MDKISYCLLFGNLAELYLKMQEMKTTYFKEYCISFTERKVRL